MSRNDENPWPQFEPETVAGAERFATRRTFVGGGVSGLIGKR